MQLRKKKEENVFPENKNYAPEERRDEILLTAVENDAKCRHALSLPQMRAFRERRPCHFFRLCVEKSRSNKYSPPMPINRQVAKAAATADLRPMSLFPSLSDSTAVTSDGEAWSSLSAESYLPPPLPRAFSRGQRSTKGSGEERGSPPRWRSSTPRLSFAALVRSPRALKDDCPHDAWTPSPSSSSSTPGDTRASGAVGRERKRRTKEERGCVWRRCSPLSALPAQMMGG